MSTKQETQEIRELNSTELDAVSGAHPALMVVIALMGVAAALYVERKK